jgi:hypothetical protein
LGSWVSGRYCKLQAIDYRFDTSRGFSGFTYSSTGYYSSCGGVRMIGGYGRFGRGYVQKKTLNLPPGLYNIYYNYYAVDSWDYEYARFSANGVMLYNRRHRFSGSNRCGGGWGDSTGLGWGTIAHGNIMHAGGNMYLQWWSTVDQGSTDESFGINNVRVLRTRLLDNVKAWRYPTYSGWYRGTQRSTCGGYGMLGGYGQFGARYYTYINLNLPSGNYYVTFKYYFVDSWDYEWGYFWYNGSLRWRRQHRFSGDNWCGGGWGDSTGMSFAPITVYISGHRSGTFQLKFGTSINQGSTDESFGVDQIAVGRLS